MNNIKPYGNSFASFANYFARFVVKKISICYLNTLLLVIISLISDFAYCQEKNLSEIIINIAEELAGDESDQEAATQYIDRLQELSENPVRLNSADEAEIARLFFLTDFQIKALTDYIHSSGKILSVFEVTNIPGFDKQTTEMIIPFISLDNTLTLKPDSASVKWRSRLITNISEKLSATDTSLQGSPVKILTKYKFTSGRFSGGFTVEKDPGEKFLNGSPPMPDFFSAHVAFNGTGYIRKIIVGDYSARFGQGTSINTGIRTGLSLSSPGYMAARNEIRPYTSTDENNFFRGVAGEFSVKNLAVALYYSTNRIDASTASSSGTSADKIENFYMAGLHTSSTLMLKKDVVSDLAYGINLSYNFKNLRLGTTWTEDRLSLPLAPAGSDPEAIYDFRGSKNSLYSLYYNSLIKRILLFGELTLNEALQYALVQGVTFRPSDRLSINFLFRDYNAGFISLHGKAPSASSAAGSENGITGNFNFEAAKHLFLSGGVDVYNFPWLRYRCSSPSSGTKQELRARFLPNEKLTIEALYNYRLTVSDDSESSGIPKQKEAVTKNIKGSLRYSVFDYLTIGSRIDYKISDPARSKGMLLSQDFICRFSKLPVTLWLRYAIFKTDDWDSRIYVYENDLLYSFSIPALSGEGSRSYIMIKWDIGDAAEIRIKYGETFLTESNTGNETKGELKFQLKVLF